MSVKKGNIPWNKGIKGAINSGSFKARELHPRWTGGKIKTGKGYVKILAPDHPNRDCKGYIFFHRVVVEKRVGRYLHRWEIVHHANHIKDDNEDKNLELKTKKIHDREEAKRRWAIRK